MFPQSFVIDPQPKLMVAAGLIYGALGVRLALLNNSLRQMSPGEVAAVARSLLCQFHSPLQFGQLRSDLSGIC